MCGEKQVMRRSTGGGRRHDRPQPYYTLRTDPRSAPTTELPARRARLQRAVLGDGTVPRDRYAKARLL